MAPQLRILAALEALKSLDRQRAVDLLREDLRHGPASGERWSSVAKLATQIGEIDITVEAARRYSRTEPAQLDRLLQYWSELGRYGRTGLVHEELGKLPVRIRRHPGVLHFLGTIAGQEGDFTQAERLFREALAQSPGQMETWFALAMIKTFTPSDPDLSAMESIRTAMGQAEPSIRARFLYGLAKAWHDCGEFDRAFDLYSEGATLRRSEDRWNSAAIERFVDELIRDFTPESMKRLIPSGSQRPALFVNGLPRSGTTLVEQILASHSRVADGGEINLLRAALLPTGDHSFAGALRYQQRVPDRPDPWGDVAADYFRLLEMRFGTADLVVDKTLGQSLFMGLLLHVLPEARVIWMRRDPEDTALSCFRTFFASSVPWSWSLEDIGRFFRLEDRLHSHWTEIFPERILTVDYQALTAKPDLWIPRIASHYGLRPEPSMFESHRTKRDVLTASVQQVRAPINTSRIGGSSAYSAHLMPFRKAFRG